MESKFDRFIIPKVNKVGLALSVARVAGEAATVAISEARKNNQKPMDKDTNAKRSYRWFKKSS